MGLKKRMIDSLNTLSLRLDFHFGNMLAHSESQNKAIFRLSDQLGAMMNGYNKIVNLVESIDSVQKEILARQEVLEATICELSEGLYEEDEDISYAEVRKTFDHPDVPISSSLTRFLNNGVAVEVSWSEEDQVYLGRFVDKFPSLSCHGDTEEETFEIAKDLLEHVLRDMADEDGHPQPHPLVYCRSIDKSQGTIIGIHDFAPIVRLPSEELPTKVFADEVRSLLDYYGHDVQAMSPTEMLNLLEEILAVSNDREEMAKTFMATRKLLNEDPICLKDFGGFGPEFSPRFIHNFVGCVLSDLHSIKERLFDSSYVFDLPRDGSAPTYGQIINAVREVIGERKALKRETKSPTQEMNRIVDLAMEAKKNG